MSPLALSMQNCFLQENIPFQYFEEVESTNDYAKEKLSSATTLEVAFTDFQTRGRGRYQRQWISPRVGSAILATWVLPLEQIAQLSTSIQIGISLHKSLKACFPHLDLKIKAPNDLYLENKKIAGILLETSIVGNKSTLYIGTGINWLNSPEALESSTHLASSFSPETFREFLSHFIQELKKLPELVNSPSLSQNQIQYLKKYFFLKEGEELLEIQPDASLIYSDKSIHWSQL